MRNKTLLQKLDRMLDEALAGTFSVQSYDESLLSKAESKMAAFLEQSQLEHRRIEDERARVRTLVSDISHQTKTPLANIMLYTQLLSEQDLAGEQKMLVERISENAEKLEFLIQSLMKISRLEDGTIRIEPEPGDVYELVRTAIRECESLALARSIKLMPPPASAPVMALLDLHWCTEALVNIVENAVKYTPENGRVSLSVVEYEMFVCVEVADTGRGIREEDFPKVFKRFWRAPESAGTQGVGIGLYLAREIITACGGYVKLGSRIGEGSTFSVFLSKV